ncbi:MAG TPA: hypothetical protein VIA18_16830 [Polyangia bacterium]|nr:hypothetical protein [Polyangia bacterium]
MLIASLMALGVRLVKTSALTYEVKATNYVPASDLAILFVFPNSLVN